MNLSKIIATVALSVLVSGAIAQVSPCPQVLIYEKYDHIGNPRYRSLGWDTAVTCLHPQLELTSEPYIPVQYFNGTYLVEQVDYNPPDTSFHMGTKMNINSDDVFAPTATNIPYPFYFFGIRKTGFVIGSNGIVTFNTGAADQTCPWGYSAPIPWPDGTSDAPSPLSYMRDAIYGVFEDTHPLPTLCTGHQGIYYGIQDNFPCRKIICSWNEVPPYPGGSNQNNRCTYQIVCYEGSNIIEVHVKHRRVDQATSSGWQNRVGIIGIQNATGTAQVKSTEPGAPNFMVVNGSPAAFYPAGKNTFNDTVHNVAYRFTPQGTTAKSYNWKRITPEGDTVPLTQDVTDPNGYYTDMDPTNTDHPTLTHAYVSPKVPTTYLLTLKFRNANGDLYDLVDVIRVGVDTSDYLLLNATSNGHSSGDDHRLDICYGQTTDVTLNYTEVQQPETISWDKIVRIKNGVEMPLPTDMYTIEDSLHRVNIIPDPHADLLPRNKIDSIFLLATVNFISGCTNYDTVLVRVFPNFDTTEVAGICQGETYHWATNGKDYSITTNEPTVNLHSIPGCDSIIHLNLTVYDVSLTIDHIEDCKPITWRNGQTYSENNEATAATDTITLKNRYNCDSVLRLDFVIHPLTAKIESSLSHFDFDHLDVELTDASFGSNSRLWHFPTGVDQTTKTAFYSIPVELDSALIELIAYSPYGCTDTAHIMLPFIKETFWIPNAFTPTESQNNLFGAISTSTLKQEMYIYNRNGEMVFHCDSPDCMWDGKNIKTGELCPQGAYAYIIRFTNRFEPNIVKIRKGTVTLIR